ncbi:MAG: NYN domain-containing protein [Actinobacteria bacterium]|nr:NYN domain-containing protein [Actinomycetota bacterium]
MKRKVLIVDGHNVIFKSPELRDLKESAIEKLINILNSLSFIDYDELYVVFDASENIRKVYEVGRVKVIMCAKNESADVVIVEILTRFQDEKNIVQVVSDDYSVQLGAVRSGQLRMTSREFFTVVDRKTDLKEFSRYQKKRRNLAEFLSEDERIFLEDLYRKLVKEEKNE